MSPTQQRILAQPSPVRRDAPYRFDVPAGPVFTEQQKAAQREAGTRLVALITNAWRSGAASIRVSPGDYRFGKERWNKDGVVYALEFDGLARDAEHPFTIDATGVTFWFDLGNDQAPHAHFCVGFKRCRNVILQGVTIDRDPCGNFEGRITRFDFDKNRIELQPVPETFLPVALNANGEQRVLPYKADGSFCGPLYALQKGGIHLKYRAIESGDGYWCYVRSVAGSRVVFTREHGHRMMPPDLVVGDEAVFLDRDSGKPLGRARVAGIEKDAVVLDASAAAFANAIVEWPDHESAGWLFQGCEWRDNYQRVLIQSGPGTLRNCTVVRSGSSLELSSVMPYVEGGRPLWPCDRRQPFHRRGRVIRERCDRRLHEDVRRTRRCVGRRLAHRR